MLPSAPSAPEPRRSSLSKAEQEPCQADLLLEHGLLVTMDPDRRVFADGAIAIRDGAIADIGPASEVGQRWRAKQVVDLHGDVALPGLVNAHVHLTGMDLFPGLEPADSPVAEHLSRWAIPSHVHNTPDDERATARFVAVQMLHQGITSFIEAGTIRFPEAVLDGLSDLGLRGVIGTWTCDRWAEPPEFAADTQTAIRRMHAALDLTSKESRVRVWPTLIGHTACSDELWRAAADAARARDSHWSFHMSPGPGDSDFFRVHTGRDPLVHLETLGVLDERAVVTHALYVSDAEVDALNRSGATVALCPAGNLHLASGLTRASRHMQMERVALGTDSPHNFPFLHTAGLACSLFGDMHRDRARLLPERALEWLTLAGARAFGAADRIGSLEVGKRADVAVFEVLRPMYNVVNAVVHHATTGRAVHVFIDGDHVVRNGQIAAEAGVVAAAAAAGERVLQRAGMPTRTGWVSIE
jgi:5-methylthioadenosine/S-adenosylhomocysteine deaminase